MAICSRLVTALDPGRVLLCRYGYFRPTIRLFDPGWNGLQVKGAEDENTGDNGNDPLGILDRHALKSATDKLVCSSISALSCSWSHAMVASSALHIP